MRVGVYFLLQPLCYPLDHYPIDRNALNSHPFSFSIAHEYTANFNY
jgi:hypothetical protein